MQNYPHKQGRYPNQAHVRVPEGTFELEYARDGFFSEEASHLYVTEPPSNWKRIEGDLKPRAVDCRTIVTADSENADALPTSLLSAAVWCGKKTLSFFLSKRQEAMPYIYKSIDGDEMYFVHDGYGRIETEFGVLEYEPGDYILMPRGCLYRVIPENHRTFMIICESISPYRIPDRGLLGPHAIFDKGVLRLPDFDAPREEWAQDEYEVRVKRLGYLTKFWYDFNPLASVAGWKGTLTPYILNVRDIRPISMLNNHVAPTANTTFQSDDVLVTTFAPRALGNAETLRVPFYHRNIDYDEFIFYYEGNFFSKAGIEPGMFTLHPAGLDHGPHPKAFERDRENMERLLAEGQEYAIGKSTAINFDTTHMLFSSSETIEAEWKGYHTSWYDQAQEMEAEGTVFGPNYSMSMDPYDVLEIA
ncbi:MAG: homogentisate 1,2-dioxygenase [Chloroflexota bacterium]